MSVRTESVSSQTRTRGEVSELTRRRRAPPPGPPAVGAAPAGGRAHGHMVEPRPCACPDSRRTRSSDGHEWPEDGDVVPPAGFEPALSPPEGDALSPELRGLRARTGYQPP